MPHGPVYGRNADTGNICKQLIVFGDLAVGKLFETVRQLVMEGRYIIGQHAAERLEDRAILEWQVVDGIDHGLLIFERSEAIPNPAVEVLQTLADGTQVNAVWSYLISADIAKLVTVHFFDE